MMRPLIIVYSSLCLFGILSPCTASAHDVMFCGEKIPVENNIVSSKLMNIIRRQIPQVNLPQLRRRARENFPMIESYLREIGLPEDLKYIAIVESGFINAISSAGARGIWQLMPSTAKEKGLLVTDMVDERDNLDKATRAACYLLGEYYSSLQKRYKISSWVLTAAAYNFGINNIYRFIDKQGKDYFSMQLNPETAVYVYKIIAVKELFEYPEFYLKDFGYNIFNPQILPPPKIVNINNADTDTLAFMSLNLNVGDKEKVMKDSEYKPAYKFIGATIKGRYNNFEDRDLVTIVLQENFEIKGSFRSKGTILKGTGWIIDGKIFIDMGYDHDVIIYDKNGNGGEPGKQGIEMSLLKNNEPILLKVKDYYD
jgi:membrane-bound lytic murein transglycosylase D